MKDVPVPVYISVASVRLAGAEPAFRTTCSRSNRNVGFAHERLTVKLPAVATRPVTDVSGGAAGIAVTVAAVEYWPPRRTQTAYPYVEPFVNPVSAADVPAPPYTTDPSVGVVGIAPSLRTNMIWSNADV